ncbi:MAG: exodeoxyribonuclease V subunit gamma, partial [Desulfobacterales bacterium]
QNRIREKYNSHWGEQPLYLERGNRLIASMGILGRDFFHLVHEFDSHLEERFEDGGVDTLLSCIQTDILNLEDRQPPAEPYPLKADDTSILIHSCHSPMRELEVLHDQLLAMFEEDPALMPRDVFVMTPDIETYAPYIHAVFDAQTDENLHIPYRIADRSVRSQSRVIEGFMSLLDLGDSRMSAVQVMALLEIAPIREAYGLSETDLDMIRRWIKDTHIRWGIDGASRRKIGLPDLPDNTWQFGIDRLLLGYAMPGGDSRLYEGILPYDHIEGNDAIVLGKFLEFTQRLFEMSDDLHHNRNIEGWSSFLNGMLEQFIADDEAIERDIQAIRKSIETLTRQAALAEWDETVDLDVICSYLNQRFTREDMGFGFISGGVTFCAMLPMRSIPAKVICLIGMGTDAFPRNSTSLGFDYLARYPKRGDRSRRNDDKYLFLEAMISARERLYISYVGRSIQDNSRIPPSSLVSELLDYILDGFGLSEPELVTHHRLQAFSPRYFSEEDGGLFSYSEENLLAAVSYDDEEGPAPFLSDPLAPAPEAWRELTMDQLVGFYNHPTRYFLETRLGIRIREQQTPIDETEDFNLDGLGKYTIGQDLVGAMQQGGNPLDHMQLQRAKGTLPHGKVGEVLYGEMSADAQAFIDRISGPTAGDRLEARDVRFQSGGFQVACRLTDLFRTGQVRVRYGNRRAKDLLNAWLHHLMLHEEPASDTQKQTLLICKDSAWKFRPLDNSREILTSLLQLYWQGLSEPIHFFPESSFSYAQDILKKHKTPDAAIGVARQKWLGNEFARGE